MSGASQGPMTPASAGAAPGEAAAALSRSRSDAGRLALLLTGAFLLRAFLAARGEVIFNDGPRFLAVAKAFAEGETRRALSHVYHPLYSWLTAKLFPLLGDYERAALAVSVVTGTLVGVPLWLLLRDLFGRRVAWAGVVLWAVHPFAAEYAANVQSDSTYLLFFTAAAAFLWRGLSRLPAASAAAPFALAGASSALAYLTRPEGAGVVALGGLWLVAGLWRSRGGFGRELPARALAGFLLVATFLAFSLPYLRHIHETTGYWQLTRKKSLSTLAGVKEYERPDWSKDPVKDEVTAEYGRPPVRRETPVERYALRGLRLFVTFAKALTWPLVPFLLLGLAVRGRALWRTRGDLFLLSFLALYGATLYRLTVTLGYAGRRHMFPVALLALGWTALGVVTFSRRLEDALRARGRAWAMHAGAVVLGLLVIASLPRTLRTNVNEPIGEKQAGRWIRQHAGAGEVRVFAPRERILYYAGARTVRVPLRFAYAPAIAYLRRYGTDFVVTSDSMTDRWFPDFRRSVRPGDLRLEAEFPERLRSQTRYRVYRVLYPQGKSADAPPLPRSMQSWDE